MGRYGLEGPTPEPANAQHLLFPAAGASQRWHRRSSLSHMVPKGQRSNVRTHSIGAFLQLGQASIVTQLRVARQRGQTYGTHRQKESRIFNSDLSGPESLTQLHKIQEKKVLRKSTCCKHFWNNELHMRCYPLWWSGSLGSMSKLCYEKLLTQENEQNLEKKKSSQPEPSGN